MKENFLACPACLCFDTDLPPDAKPGDKCSCCGEAVIDQYQRRDFLKLIAKKIIIEMF